MPFKLRTSVLAIILTLLITPLGFMIWKNNSIAQTTPEVDAGPLSAEAAFAQCIQDELLAYMQALLDAKASGLLPDNIQLLSPAFNMTSSTLGSIAGAVNSLLPQFSGIAGNLYDTNGVPMYDYDLSSVGSGPIYITESGNTNNSNWTNQQTADHIAELFSRNPQVRMVNLFVPTDEGNLDPGFAHHRWTDSDFDYLCSKVDCKKIGINYGSSFGQAKYDTLRKYGFGSVVQIAQAGGENQVIQTAQNLPPGTNLVLRIGTGAGSGGFDNVNDYISFLQKVSAGLPPGVNFFAIGGPNEPDLETWIAPMCQFLSPSKLICEGPIDIMQVSYRGEVVGHNADLPWAVNSNIDTGRANSMDDLANRIQSKFMITVPLGYEHNDLRVISDQINGAYSTTDSLYYDDRLMQVVKDAEGNPKLDAMGNPVKVMSPLNANIPLFNSALPGYRMPAAYGMPADFEFQFAEDNETPEEYLERMLGKTQAPAPGKEPEFGLLSDIPVVMFRACIQRSTCDPNREECLRTDGSGDLCTEDEDPAGCISRGRVFDLTGKIAHREPTELHSISRAYDMQRRQIVDQPGQPVGFDQVISQSDITRSRFVYADTDLAEISAGTKQINTIAQAENESKYTSMTGQEVQIKKENSSSLTNPTTAQAQSAFPQPEGSLTVNVEELGGNRVRLNYETCIWHQLDSACAIRDVSTVINGEGTFNYIPVTQPNIPRCLKPSWGNAPEITADLAPGTCTTVNVETRGGRVGPEGCNDSYSSSCQVCRGNDGAITQSCGKAPPPKPADCSRCDSWAPSWLCSQIQADSLPEENECADGSCTTQGYVDVEEDLWDERSQNDNSLWTWIVNTVTGAIADTGLRCDPTLNFITDNIFDLVDINCRFGSKDYLVYAYPISYTGDFGSRTVDMSVNNAMFRMTNKTDQYFWPKSTKAPVQLKLTVGDRRATLNNTDSDAPGIGAAPPDETSLIDWVSGNANRNNFWVGLNDDGVRTMFVEYYYFMQPQTSGQCLKQRLLTQPMPPAGAADSTISGVPQSHDTLCSSQDFWATGVNSSITTAGVDSRIASAAEQINAQKNLAASNDGKIGLELDIDNDIEPILSETYEEDQQTLYANSDIRKRVSYNEYVSLQSQFEDELDILIQKELSKPNGKEKAKNGEISPAFKREVESLIQRYQGRLGAKL